VEAIADSRAPGSCFCGRGRADASAAHFSQEQAARGGEWAGRLRRCAECRLVFLDSEAAPSGGGYLLIGPLDFLVAMLWRWRAGRIARGAPRGGRALDVGAGTGRLVSELVRRGLDAFGLEPSPQRAPLDGERIIRGALSDGIPGDEPFDLVVFWHSLEHHAAPFSAVSAVAARMREGARLVIAVPNIDSLQARLAGSRWLHLELPYHRAHFTASTLRTLVEDAGFEVERLSIGQVEMDLMGMLDALCVRVGMRPRFCFDALAAGGRAGPRALATRALGLVSLALVLPVAAVFCAAARLAGRAGVLRLTARRIG